MISVIRKVWRDGRYAVKCYWENEETLDIIIRFVTAVIIDP